MTVLTSRRRKASVYSSDADRWRAVVARDSAADGEFVFSVRSTGIYCRPGCPARRPLRKNVRFHASCQEAEASGFRACKRCRPKEASLAARQGEIIAAACRAIDAAESTPSLQQLARSAGMSPFHFHRLFQAATGTTPKRYALARRAERLRADLRRGESVTTARQRAGLASPGRFQETARSRLGLSPGQLRALGRGATIRYACGDCWLGTALIAATERGICAIFLGDEEQTLIEELANRFPQAERLAGDRAFQATVRRAIALLERPSADFDLPLDIQGTAFECRVWEALREIPPGETVTYTEIAQRLGQPSAVRAVARACATNKIAVAIPCHRVVRRDGSLAGYRWGLGRKSELLAREEKEGRE